MDMTTCVARRTRSRTESHMVSMLNQRKGISVEDQSEVSLNLRTAKKRASMRNACSPSPVRSRRRRRKANEDDDVEFIGSTTPERNREHELVEEGRNAGSDPVISPRLESKLIDSDRVFDFVVDDANLRGEEKTPVLTLSDSDDDVVFVETIPREEEHVENYNVDGVCDFPVDDADLNGEETPPGPVFSDPDEIMSLTSSEEEYSRDEASGEDRDSGDSDGDEDGDNESDYVEESSDSTYIESSESEFDCSGDDEGDVGDAAKGRKSPNQKVYTHERRRKTLPRENRDNNLDVFQLLAKSIWEKTKIFEEDVSSADETPEETPEVDCREDAIVRESSSEKVHEQRKPRNRRRVKEKNQSNVFDLLGDSVWGKGESFDGGPTEDSPLINLRFGCEEPEPVEKTEEEKEIDRLWEDMALALKLEGLHSSTPAKNGDVPCIKGKHDFVLDEEIGLKCRHCSYVVVEIRDISPAMDHYRANVSDKNNCSDRKGDPLFSRLDFGASDHSCYAASLNDTEGTVWQYIPGVKDTLYPHQQEGFEFIWKNLAGTTKLDELESFDVRESGGCIISHSPGTGKTRLTIVFLQSYLEWFPDSHPVVIAPASLLLTWEEEFRKWNANIPFYNMGTLEFSGLEDQSAVSLLKGNKSHRSKRSIRMVKLYSWRNKKSILGVSYHLFEKLARNKDAEFRRMLLELPGLVVLDEGHTPRNQNSCIWKVLSEVKTEKRIILSGTPFQNNFKELSNVLCLARPAYTDSISSRLQDLSRWSKERKNGGFYEEVEIGKLKTMIAPFVHVYKGNILRESLPGLRDCVVVLKPPHVQNKILTRIDPHQNTFELEHKLSAVSVHPSLYMDCNPTKKEKMLIGPVLLNNLESLRLNSKEGVKTRFLIDFIRFCETVKEKVLVFSQYNSTLELIRDQLSVVFGWKKGEEILYMHGQVEQRDRQHIINDFNKPDSESKVLLASTRACSEGINLVGASRVILLDVVWNPSVERQAISRAYRIGQKRVVYTYHLMAKGTTEWEKYCKQNEKHQISELVFSSTSEKDVVINKEVVSEDRILDEMVRHEKLKDMFEKILYHPKESDMSTNIL